MKSVIHQEWGVNKERIVHTTIILGILNLFMLFSVLVQVRMGAEHWVLNVIIGIAAVADAVGIWLFPLINGCGNMGFMLKGDTAWLMKMIPVPSWKLIGGRLVMGLCEFLLYGIQVLIYGLLMLLILPDGVVDLSEIFNVLRTYGNVWRLIGAIVRWGVIGFLYLQTLINLIKVSVSAISRKLKIPRGLVIIAVLVGAWFVQSGISMIISASTSNYVEGFKAGNYADVWPVFFTNSLILSGIGAAFAAVYYGAAAFIYDRFIEV